MRVLDAFCCQGGASAGYSASGALAVAGIDLFPQPRYPFPFYRGDAVQLIRQLGPAFDFIHASPPRQFYSATQRIQGNEHEDLIGATRDALNETGVPWVIENVGEAVPWMNSPVMLCGASFGLHTYRHRFFETGGGFTFTAPEHLWHRHRTVKMGRRIEEGDWYHAVGNFSGVSYARRDMNVPWMNRDGIRECIPPVYAEYVGNEFRKWRNQMSDLEAQLAAEAAQREAERQAAAERAAQAARDAQAAIDAGGVSIPPGAWGH